MRLRPKLPFFMVMGRKERVRCCRKCRLFQEEKEKFIYLFIYVDWGKIIIKMNIGNFVDQEFGYFGKKRK